MILENVVKVLLPSILTFAAGMTIAPIIHKLLIKYKIYKKKPGKTTLLGEEAQEFNRLHKEKEKQVPRMGGLVIWVSVVFVAALLWSLSFLFEDPFLDKLNFISRSQTWIPLFVLILGGVVGLLNDYLDAHSHGNGLSLERRLFFVTILSAFVGWWFYKKLEVTGISIPFGGVFELGVLIIPFFILFSLFIYASGIIDGIDGLSGGVFAAIFAAYTGIALYQDQIDIAAFSSAVLGGILAFLWHNVPPAKFYMTETGTMALTLVLSTIAFMTDSLGGGIGVAVFPIIGFLLVITVLSNIVQVTYKKITGKKFFKIAPIHHHFQAIGVPSETVVMRYWIVAIFLAFVGFLIALIG